MRIFFLLAMLLANPTAVAQGPDSAPVAPPVEGQPVQVQAGIYVVDIENINEVNNTFHAELDMIGSWNDPRLAFDAEQEGSDHRVFLGVESGRFLERLWSPQMVPENAVGTYDIVRFKMTIFADGKIVLEARLAMTLNARLDYRRFPFDRQTLPIRIESFAWNADQLVLSELPGQSGIDPDFNLSEWRIGQMTVVGSEVTRPRTDVPYSRLTFAIEIERKSGFYVWKIFLPLLIIVAISWVVFWMSQEFLGRRAGVSVTGILTVIAYQFIVASLIPRVPYLTTLDQVMLFSIVMIASTLFVSIFVDKVKRKGTEERAHQIDKSCRIIFPVLYVSVVGAIVAWNLLG